MYCPAFGGLRTAAIFIKLLVLIDAWNLLSQTLFLM